MEMSEGKIFLQILQLIKMLHKLSVQTLQQWVVGSGGWSPVS